MLVSRILMMGSQQLVVVKRHVMMMTIVVQKMIAALYANLGVQVSYICVHGLKKNMHKIISTYKPTHIHITHINVIIFHRTYPM